MTYMLEVSSEVALMGSFMYEMKELLDMFLNTLFEAGLSEIAPSTS